MALVNSTTDTLKKPKLRDRTVAFYNIWPGNGVGLFLQPQSPHGSLKTVTVLAANFYVLAAYLSALILQKHWYSHEVHLDSKVLTFSGMEAIELH